MIKNIKNKTIKHINMDMIMSGSSTTTRLFTMEGRDHHNHDQTNNTAGSSSSASENGSDPSSTPIFHITTTSSPKKSGSRRSVQKRVVTIPIKEMEGNNNSRLKGDTCHISTPPSDSWAWRKYGQKPIKGSPYPRGYYRCSSSKGCPARKQVERSRVDPTMLLVTYSAEHNHPWPANSSRNNHSQSSTATSKPLVKKENQELLDETKAISINNDNVATETGNGFGGHVDDGFGWFGTHHHMESPVFADGSSGGACDHAHLADVFPMGEEDESLFADLGELPECSLVFRVGPQLEIF